MKIKKIYLAGIGIYKNPIEVYLGEGITVVTGETGVGKTMLMQAPYYALYGKDPYRNCDIQDIMSGESADIEVEFIDGDNVVRIVRNYMGKKFVSGAVIVNDLVDYSSPKVTSFNRYIANRFGAYQPVVLTTLRTQGSSSGFFSLENRNKRSFLIDILIPPNVYKTITKSYDYFKDKLNEVKIAIAKIEGAMDIVDQADVRVFKKRIKEQEKIIKQLTKEREKAVEKIAVIKQIKKQISDLEKNLFDEVPVACDDSLRAKCELYKVTIDRTNKNKEKINELKQTLEKLYKEAPDLNAIDRKIREARSIIDSLNEEIENSTRISRKDKEKLIKDYDVYTKKQAIYESLVKIFSDRGMPSFILNNRLPLLEASVNMMLDKINPSLQEPITIKIFSLNKTKSGGLKSSIEIKVYVGGREIDYKHLSGGQKALVESAFSIGSAVFMQNYSKTPFRFMILDEPTIGMDDELSATFYNAVREMMAGYFNQVIIISHNDSIIEMADDVLKLPLDK